MGGRAPGAPPLDPPMLCNIYHVKASSTSVCTLVLQLVVHILKQFLMQLCSLHSFNKLIVNYLDYYLNFTHVHIFILLENRLLLELIFSSFSKCLF